MTSFADEMAKSAKRTSIGAHCSVVERDDDGKAKTSFAAVSPRGDVTMVPPEQVYEFSAQALSAKRDAERMGPGGIYEKKAHVVNCFDAIGENMMKP